MFSLLKKKTASVFTKTPRVTVEEIHAEFDSGEERILNECQKILDELKIPTETQIEKKSKLLQEIGFVNSETVKQSESFFKRRKEIEIKKEVTRIQAETIKSLKMKYPFEKFITTEELDRICTKYGLIHAPIKNYIKDVPEKNLLEIKGSKKLHETDCPDTIYRLVGLKSDYLLEIFGKETPDFTESDMERINYKYKSSLLEWFRGGDSTWSLCAVKYGVDGKPGKTVVHDLYTFKKTIVIDKRGYYIAAPPSHFDLIGLSKETKYGFFGVTEMEVKDPVVFEFCKNGLVRIITKWGTDDDQAYLDPALTNETMN
jgi:hypothetical protein